jgi:ribosomal protein S12 methylthiotransferase accessory factor
MAETEAAFREALGPEGIIDFDIGPLDRVGVPVWAVWWTDPGAARRGGGIGYGPTAERARIGGLGEALESVSSARHLATMPRQDASEAEMVRRAGRDHVVDPRLLGLPAGTEYGPDRPLRWTALQRLADGAPVWVPEEFVASSPADLAGAGPAGGPLVVPVTNGLGAHRDRDRAIAHAVGEILQRDGNGLVFRALDRGVVVDLDGLTDPDALDALHRLRSAGVDVMVKLASTGHGTVNVYAVGCARDDDLVVATACGEAAEPDRDRAVRKALLEFAAARARKAFMHGPLDAVDAVAPTRYLERVLPGVDPAREEQRVLAAMLEWTRMRPADWRPLLDATVFSRRSTVAFHDLPTAAVPADRELDHLASHLAAEGFDVLVADFPAGEGAHAVKVVVPGMEVETVAYARIGERNAQRLIDLGRDDLVRVGAAPAGWSRIALTPAAEERLGGPAWLDRARLAQVRARLLPLYREPSRHALQVALSRGGPAAGRAVR